MALPSLRTSTKVLLTAGILLSLLIAEEVFAQGTRGSAPAGSLGEVALRVTSSFRNLAKLITAAAYVAGMGFAITAILKFKSHKDNPQQVPVGTPIALIFIAAAMLFLPEIFRISGTTLFGEDLEVAGVEGTELVPGAQVLGGGQ